MDLAGSKFPLDAGIAVFSFYNVTYEVRKRPTANRLVNTSAPADVEQAYPPMPAIVCAVPRIRDER